MRKLKKALLLILILSLALAPAGALAATPGSAGDPLVTKSWVDEYVNAQFAAVQARLDAVKQQYQALYGMQPVSIRLYIGKSQALVNGATRYIDPERPAVVPQLKTNAAGGGYTMVPIRFIAEAMGVTVEWMGATRQVLFTDGNKRVLLNVDSKEARINGVSSPMEYAPFIENQRTYVHIRFVAEAFDCDVKWTQSEKRADISR